MWVFEEMIHDRKLTEIINTDHENVKYLPGFKLPENVVAGTRVSVESRGPDLCVSRHCKPLQFQLSCALLLRCRAPVPDLAEAARDSTLLIFVLPHQVPTLCSAALSTPPPTGVPAE